MRVEPWPRSTHDDARERFERLAAEVVEPVRRFLARRTDPDTAEDVLAETLLVCWRRLDHVPEHALPWVYGVARNCLANIQRGDRRQVRLAARITVVDPPQEAEREPDPPDPRVAAVLAVTAAGGGRPAPAVGVGAARTRGRSRRFSASLRTPRASGCTAPGANSWRSCERSTTAPDMKG